MALLCTRILRVLSTWPKCRRQSTIFSPSGNIGCGARTRAILVFGPHLYLMSYKPLVHTDTGHPHTQQPAHVGHRTHPSSSSSTSSAWQEQGTTRGYEGRLCLAQSCRLTRARSRHSQFDFPRHSRSRQPRLPWFCRERKQGLQVLQRP
jgi:hypothetical protein